MCTGVNNTFEKVSLAALPKSPKWGGATTPDPGFSVFSARLRVVLNVSARDWFDILQQSWRCLEMDWLGLQGTAAESVQ
jgi:hypothetical protein